MGPVGTTDAGRRPSPPLDRRNEIETIVTRISHALSNEEGREQQRLDDHQRRFLSGLFSSLDGGERRVAFLRFRFQFERDDGRGRDDGSRRRRQRFERDGRPAQWNGRRRSDGHDDRSQCLHFHISSHLQPMRNERTNPNIFSLFYFS